MKKVFYIVLVIVALLVISQVVKKNPAPMTEPEVVAVEEGIAVEGTTDAPVIEEDVVVVDQEPAADEAAAPAENIDENIVEQNPDATAAEGETVD